jgi:hypothetical protein
VIDASIDKPKHVLIEIGGPTPTSLHFHTGSKDNAEEILAKVHSSKAIATGSSSSRSEPAKPSLANKPSVHFSEDSPVIIPPDEHVGEEEEEYDGEFAVALYDFNADGEDELSVSEGEQLLVLERDGDEWWKCRNQHGREGVVPAQYVEVRHTSHQPLQLLIIRSFKPADLLPLHPVRRRKMVMMMMMQKRTSKRKSRPRLLRLSESARWKQRQQSVKRRSRRSVRPKNAKNVRDGKRRRRKQSSASARGRRRHRKRTSLSGFGDLLFTLQ